MQDDKFDVIKVTKENLLAATKLANMTRLLAQKNAVTADLNGKIAECDARIKAATEVIDAEKRTKQSVVSQAQTNMAEAQSQLFRRNKMMEDELGIEDPATVQALDLQMDLGPEELEEHGDDALALVLVMRDESRQAKKPALKPVKKARKRADRQGNNGDRSVDEASARDRS